MLSSLSDALHILVYLHISSYYILLQITLFLPSITKQYYYFEVCFCYVMFVCQQTVISISVLSVVLYCYMQSEADIGFLRLILFGHLKNCLPGSAVPNTSVSNREVAECHLVDKHYNINIHTQLKDVSPVSFQFIFHFSVVINAKQLIMVNNKALRSTYMLRPSYKRKTILALLYACTRMG